ncbi:hypothetical protein R3P38DRAFT_2773731 [Favolaschia claudopus]|uniref:Uncharacterized protein n=1 Tax=Favolaschia claudopus TaxID=2862362 RepID=A0AAW0C3A0_9AGAR
MKVVDATANLVIDSIESTAANTSFSKNDAPMQGVMQLGLPTQIPVPGPTSSSDTQNYMQGVIDFTTQATAPVAENKFMNVTSPTKVNAGFMVSSQYTASNISASNRAPNDFPMGKRYLVIENLLQALSNGFDYGLAQPYCEGCGYAQDAAYHTFELAGLPFRQLQRNLSKMSTIRPAVLVTPSYYST